MARSLLHRLDRLRRREPPLEDGPAELVLGFSAAPDGAYWVHARSREDPDGVQGRFRPPEGRFGAARLAGRLRGCHRHAVPVSADPTEGTVPPDPHRAGHELLEALLADPEVRRLYDDTRAAAPDGRFRLRLVLDPDHPGMAALHALPWELLFERGLGKLLAVEDGATVVRTLRVRRRARPFEPRRPLRVLALLSGARDLDLERERRELEAAAREVGGLELVVEHATDLTDLEKLLAAGRGGRPFHVLHLAGHGGIAAGPEGGVLVWDPPVGGRREIAGRHLSSLLGRFPDLRLVVLNACTTAELPGDGGDPFAGVAAALLQGGVPVVAAVQGKIRDEAAITFSRAFYSGLAAGRTTEEAMAAARRELWKEAPGELEWVKPVLFQGASSRRLARWVLRSAAALLLALVVLAGIAVAQDWRLATRTLEQGVGEALSLLQDDRPAEAAQVLADALDRPPWPPVSAEVLAAAHATAAVAAEDLGELGDAVEHAGEAARLEPARAAHHYNLGALLSRAGRAGEAAAPLGRTLELEPGHADARNELGCVHLDLGHLEEALRVLEPGLQAHPEHALLHKNAGRALLALGRPEDATALLERALELLPLGDWPARAEAAFQLTRATAEGGDDAATCAAIRRFRQADPQGVTGHAPDAARLAGAAGCPSPTTPRPDAPGDLHAP